MMKPGRIRSGGCVFWLCFLNISVSLISLISQRGQFLQGATFNYVWMKICVCVLLIPSSPSHEADRLYVVQEQKKIHLADITSDHQYNKNKKHESRQL